MNHIQVLQLVDKIAATSSLNEKAALVKEGMNSPDFVKVMQYAYDPFKTYGLRAIPKGAGKGNWAFDMGETGVFAILDSLVARELSGDNARETVQDWLDELDPEGSELLWRILRKDMRAGFGETLINKAKPGTIPEFPYMRCSLPDKSNMGKWNWADGIISQEKADGMFANVNLDVRGMVSVHTRQGSAVPIEKLGTLEADMQAVLKHGTQSHGELLVADESGKILSRKDGNGMLNSVIEGGLLPDGHTVYFYAWDQIPLSAVKPKGKHDVPYRERLRALVQQIQSKPDGQVKLISTRLCRTRNDATAHYKQVTQRGKEGTILKHPLATWKDGTSKDQVKQKVEVDVDLCAVEIVPGKDGTKNEGRPGSIRMSSSCARLVVDVAVKNEKMRDDIEARPEQWLGRVYPVRFNDIMEPSESNPLHSLYLPRLVEDKWRIDKSVADDLEHIKDQFKAAVEG